MGKKENNLKPRKDKSTDEARIISMAFPADILKMTKEEVDYFEKLYAWDERSLKCDQMIGNV